MANRGLYEYEILPDADNTVALTLLRSVGEMGDWGYFPAPKAQMIGTWTAGYELFFFEPESCEDACTLGYQYQNPLVAAQTGIHAGNMKAVDSLFSWKGKGLNLTGFKMAENGTDVIVRFVNYSDEQTVLKIEKKDWITGIYRSNVVEKTGENLEELGDDTYETEIRPHEIATFGIRKCCQK